MVDLEGSVLDRLPRGSTCGYATCTTAKLKYKCNKVLYFICFPTEAQMLAFDFASIKFVSHSSGHAVMRFNQADRERLGVAACCSRKVAECPRHTGGRCEAYAQFLASQPGGRSTGKRRESTDATAEREAVLKARISSRRCKRWRAGWCDHPSTHGMDVHDARHGCAWHA